MTTKGLYLGGYNAAIYSIVYIVLVFNFD